MTPADNVTHVYWRTLSMEMFLQRDVMSMHGSMTHRMILLSERRASAGMMPVLPRMHPTSTPRSSFNTAKKLTLKTEFMLSTCC